MRNRIAQFGAMIRFVNGPAAATHSMSALGLRRRLKLTGTGFAQPNKTPAPNSELKAGDARRHQQGTHRIDVAQRVERYAPGQVGGVIEMPCHIAAVRGLVVQGDEATQAKAQALPAPRSMSPWTRR